MSDHPSRQDRGDHPAPPESPGAPHPLVLLVELVRHILDSDERTARSIRLLMAATSCLIVLGILVPGLAEVVAGASVVTATATITATVTITVRLRRDRQRDEGRRRGR